MSPPYNPYAPPQPGYGPGPAPIPMPYGGGMGVYAAGDALIVPKGTMMPPLCSKCGRPDGLTMRPESFAWSPPWIFIFFVFGLIGVVIGLVVLAATRKSGTLVLPLCTTCNETWDRGRRNVLIMAFGIPIVTTLLAILVGNVDDDLVALPILLGAFAWLLAPLIYHFAAHRPRTIWSRRVDDTSLTLVGFHQAVVQAACAASGTPYAQPGPPMGYPGYGGYGAPPPPQW